jgi:iron(III) transport system substrate-binding protein
VLQKPVFPAADLLLPADDFVFAFEEGVMSSRSPASRLMVVAVLLTAAVILQWVSSRWNDQNNILVLYCAHDSIFAQSIIDTFEKRTGIQVQVRFDEEANKSLGLTNLLIAEKEHPRCDVFWNNQTLGTIRLKQEGVLATSDRNLFKRIPEQFRDSDFQWAGFAARLRVLIINTDRMTASTEAVDSALASDSLSRCAIAVPLFGTTLSHYSILADQWGMAELQAWHQSLHDRGIREARGNGAVKDLVAEGACDLGFTDTDDAFAAIDAGKPVTMLPLRLTNGKTICLPNSVAMIRNCRHPEAAVLFMEYLLSEEVELALAKSASRQIPLGPVDASQLPQEVRELATWAADGVSLGGAAAQSDAVLKWLSGEYAAE